MDVVKLKDESIEIIGSHRDLVDIIRDKCGDEIAAKVEELDPSEWDNVYDAYENVISASDLLGKDEFEENDIECAKILINKAIATLSKIL